MPRHDYRRSRDDVIPALREAGMSQRDLDTMFVDNPWRHSEATARRDAACRARLSLFHEPLRR